MQNNRLSREAFQLANSMPYRVETEIRFASGNTDGLVQYIVDMHDEVLQQYIDAVRTGQMMESVALAHTGLTHEGFRLATEVCEHPRQHRKDAFIYMASTTVSQSLICTMLDYWQPLFDSRNLLNDLVVLIADFLDELSAKIINAKWRSEEAFTRSILRQVGNFEVNNSTSETVSFLPLKKWGTH